MIVDLARNDLSRVCEPGTVHCPKLMRVESYQTVHQLVSTVSGQILDRTTSGSYLKAAFPPGSMTGAPKVRSCELLERLEEIDRGVYGGCLGFISVHDACDLSVVIRTSLLSLIIQSFEYEHYDSNTGTIVCRSSMDDDDDEIMYSFTLNSGGAITMLSSPVDEYDEMLLKLRAVRTALEEEFPVLRQGKNR